MPFMWNKIGSKRREGKPPEGQRTQETQKDARAKCKDKPPEGQRIQETQKDARAKREGHPPEGHPPAADPGSSGCLLLAAGWLQWLAGWLAGWAGAAGWLAGGQMARDHQKSTLSCFY